MSFSAATCLTTTPLNVTSFDIFLGVNNYTTIFDTVSLSDITPPNCPYIVENIPDGTSYLSFKDSSGIYCFSIPVADNDICVNCNLGFSKYSASTVARLYCGELTGSCQNISDYLIHWYGPNDTTTLQFTSGKGNIFSYDWEHPFSTISTSLPVPEGVYTPVIQNVILSGLSFSNTGGTGNISFTGNCLPTTTILPLTCNFKTNTSTGFPYSAYTNYQSFNFQNQGAPVPITITHKISASTQYISWAFKGEGDPDRLRINFSGSSYYPNKIGIEDIIIGSDLTTNNFSASTYPKSSTTQNFFTKFSCLTGVTVNNDDMLEFVITPSSQFTNWELYISCLDNYECNDCLSTQNYKIIGSSISGVTGSCESIEVFFTVSGCPSNDVNSDYVIYNNNTLTQASDTTGVLSYNSLIQRQTGINQLFFDKYRCQLAGGPDPKTPICSGDSEETVYQKTFLTDGSNRGVFNFTGSSNFISTYYNALQNSFNGTSPYTPTWSGTTNPYEDKFYRYYNLRIPSYQSPNNCGDSGPIVPYIDIYLHHTSPFLSGTTSGKYYLKITANTITDYNLFSSCQLGCNSQENQVINFVNSSSTGSSTSYGNYLKIFSNGNYYTEPVWYVTYLTTGATTVTASTFNGYFRTNDWNFNTYPFSGNPSTIIPSISGSVCNYNSTGVKSTSLNSFLNTQYKYYYQIRLTNPNNVNDFDIWASPINNFSFSGAPFVAQYELAYRYSGGNVIYSASTYII